MAMWDNVNELFIAGNTANRIKWQLDTNKILEVVPYERLRKTKKCHSEKAGKVVESAASHN